MLQMQLHCLKETSGTSVREMKAFHKYLEKRDPEMKKMLRRISAENAKAATSTQKLPGSKESALPVSSMATEGSRELDEAKKEGGLVEAHEETGEDNTDNGETDCMVRIQFHYSVCVCVLILL